jgi:nondiscriminating glutamyl-tRNA synthetase
MKVLKAVREGLDRIIDIPEKLNPFSGKRILPVEGEAHSWLTTPASKTLFKTTLQELDKIDTLNGETFKESMKSVGKISGIKGKDLWMPIRVALTGDIHGPELALIVEALGKERCVILIKEALMQNSE